MHEEGRKELWSDEQLHTAVEAVSNRELKAHAAAKQYGIPSHTLYDHINGKSTKYGGAPTVLTAAEEECQGAANQGHPFKSSASPAPLDCYHLQNIHQHL